MCNFTRNKTIRKFIFYPLSPSIYHTQHDKDCLHTSVQKVDNAVYFILFYQKVRLKEKYETCCRKCHFSNTLILTHTSFAFMAVSQLKVSTTLYTTTPTQRAVSLYNNWLIELKKCSLNFSSKQLCTDNDQANTYKGCQNYEGSRTYNPQLLCIHNRIL